MTVGEFKDLIWSQLKNLPDDAEIFFGTGDLSFYRCKTRLYRKDDKTPQLVQLEFNELYEVTHTP